MRRSSWFSTFCRSLSVSFAPREAILLLGVKCGPCYFRVVKGPCVLFVFLWWGLSVRWVGVGVWLLVLVQRRSFIDRALLFGVLFLCAGRVKRGRPFA